MNSMYENAYWDEWNNTCTHIAAASVQRGYTHQQRRKQMQPFDYVLIVLVVVLIGVPLMIWVSDGTKRRKQKESFERLTRLSIAEMIQQLDLSGVRTKLRKKGWKEERIIHAEAEYRRFLFLLATHERETIVPWCEDLDEFWHQHILDTSQYQQDCQRLFGRFIHHNPNIERTPQVHRSAIARTSSIRKQEFSKSEPSRKNEDGGVLESVSDLVQAVVDAVTPDSGGGHGCSSCSSGCGGGGCGS